MNITEFMSFDLEWFTTLPGLLITGGVIILLIALIIFIISNKKADKKKVEENPVENTTSSTETNTNDVVVPETPANEMVSTVNVPMENSFGSMPMNDNVTSMNFNNPTNNTYTTSGSVNILGGASVEEPVNSPLPTVNTNDSPVIPTITEQQPIVNNFSDVSPVNNNVVDFTTVTPSVDVQPVVNEPVVVAPMNPAPSVPEENVSTPVVTPQVEATPQPVEEAKPMIYGGINPINTVNASTVVEESKPVIYGGANPLENTTTIPRISNHEAYNVSTSNSYVAPSAPVEPTQSPVVETPVVDSVVQPEVVPSAPVMEPAIVQQPVAPAMPMTGAEMFGTNDVSANADNSGSSDASNEIETLEF